MKGAGVKILGENRKDSPKVREKANMPRTFQNLKITVDNKEEEH